MRILLVHNRCQLGGIETVAKQLLAGFRAAGHDCEFWVAEGKTYPPLPGLRPMYPRLLSRLDQSRFHGFAARFFPRRRWTERRFRAIARSRFDVVHIHGFFNRFAPLEAFAAVARSKPVILTIHSLWFVTGGCYYPLGCRRYQTGCGDCPQVGIDPIGPIDHTREELMAKRRHLASAPAHVISPSAHYVETVRASLVGGEWAASWIPNGIDTAFFHGAGKRDPALRAALGLDPRRTVILLAMRDFRDRYKGFAQALEALRQIDPARCQIVLAGLDSAAAARRLPAGLTAVDAGYVASSARLAAWYRAADVFLFPSLDENFPCAVLEAMASECCVVASPIPAVVEQVGREEAGLVAAEPGGQALGRALAAAVGDPGRTGRLGAAARHRVIRLFSEGQMIEKHLALYERVLAARTAPAPNQPLPLPPP